MVARLSLVVAVAACGTSPPPVSEPKTTELVVPPMPDAGPVVRRSVVRDAGPPQERLVSYEEALATYDPPPPGTVGADITDGELAQPMRNSAFIGGCGAPDSMKVTVKVAVLRGRAAGVTVKTNPPDESVARCVDAHVRTLSWPMSEKMDSFTSTY